MVSLPVFILQIDDQVLLLQNSWAELVSLGAIWRSRFTCGVINLSYGKKLDLQAAREMEHEEVGKGKPSFIRIIKMLEMLAY